MRELSLICSSLLVTGGGPGLVVAGSVGLPWASDRGQSLASKTRSLRQPQGTTDGWKTSDIFIKMDQNPSRV